MKARKSIDAKVAKHTAKAGGTKDQDSGFVDRFLVEPVTALCRIDCTAFREDGDFLIINKADVMWPIRPVAVSEPSGAAMRRGTVVA